MRGCWRRLKQSQALLPATLSTVILTLEKRPCFRESLGGVVDVASGYGYAVAHLEAGVSYDVFLLIVVGSDYADACDFVGLGHAAEYHRRIDDSVGGELGSDGERTEEQCYKQRDDM